MTPKRPHRTIPPETKLTRLLQTDPHRLARTLAATKHRHQQETEQDQRITQLMPHHKPQTQKDH